MKSNTTDDNITNILDDCIEAIRRNETTVEECLQLHKDVRAELEPMLIAALTLIEVGNVVPDSLRKQQARDKLLAAVEQKRWESGVERNALIAAPPKRRSRIFALGGRLGIATLVFLMLMGSTMAIAAQSLPGSPLYPLKLAMENARIGLARDDNTKSKLYLHAAEERMGELKKLKGEDQHYSELVKAIATNIELAEKASANQPRQEFSAEVGKLVKKNQGVLEDTLDKAPPSAKPALQRALSNAQRATESDEHTGNGAAGRAQEKDRPATPSTPETTLVKRSDVKTGDTEDHNSPDLSSTSMIADPGSSKQQSQDSDEDKGQIGKESKDSKRSGHSDENDNVSPEKDRNADASKDQQD